MEAPHSSATAWPFASAHRLAVEAAEETAQTGALTASVFDAYRPSVRVSGACPHPTRLVESAAMAARLWIPESGDVTVDVVDALGRVVTTIQEGLLVSGLHTVAWDASAAPGVYTLRVQAASTTVPQRYVVVQ